MIYKGNQDFSPAKYNSNRDSSLRYIQIHKARCLVFYIFFLNDDNGCKLSSFFVFIVRLKNDKAYACVLFLCIFRKTSICIIKLLYRLYVISFRKYVIPSIWNLVYQYRKNNYNEIAFHHNVKYNKTRRTEYEFKQ